MFLFLKTPVKTRVKIVSRNHQTSCLDKKLVPLFQKDVPGPGPSGGLFFARTEDMTAHTKSS